MRSLQELTATLDSLTKALDVMRHYGSGYTNDDSAIETTFIAIKSVAEKINEDVNLGN